MEDDYDWVVYWWVGILLEPKGGGAKGRYVVNAVADTFCGDVVRSPVVEGKYLPSLLTP